MVVLAAASLAISLYQMFQSAPEPPTPDPDQLDGMPTAEQGKPIPVLFGTRIISQPNVVWYATGAPISEEAPEISANGLTPPLRIMVNPDEL